MLSGSTLEPRQPAGDRDLSSGSRAGSTAENRGDDGYWQQVEVYLHEHSQVTFTHGLRPDCTEAYLAELEDSGQFPVAPS